MKNHRLKIAILSRGPRLYSTRRLREAIIKAGHQARVLDTLRFGLYVRPSEPDLTYAGKHIAGYDAIIPRIGASITFFGTAVVRQFEQMGVFCLNTSHPITISRDKLRSMQILSRHDIGIAESAFVRRQSDVLPAVEEMGGAPVIIKLLEGTQGVGVILADTQKVAEAIVETLQSTRQNVLIQKFVSESRGRDIRAIVVGDRVVAAMRRRAKGQEFRSNVHRGGDTEAVTLDEAFERTAVRASQIMGLKVAGVDMLEGKDGPVIMEVNSSPGLEGIEAATGVDVAGEMIRYLDEQVHFGDLDVRQRLTLARGYSVVEFDVQPDSDLVGKTIEESGLRERDVIVLRITRGDQHYAIPRRNRVIEKGDLLLCYGNQVAIRSYLPTLVPKRRRRKKKKITKRNE